MNFNSKDLTENGIENRWTIKKNIYKQTFGNLVVCSFQSRKSQLNSYKIKSNETFAFDFHCVVFDVFSASVAIFNDVCMCGFAFGCYVENNTNFNLSTKLLNFTLSHILFLSPSLSLYRIH